MSETVTSSETTLTSQEVVAWTKKLNYGTWKYQKSWNPLHVVDAEGCYFTDANGKRYLDFSAQLMCCNLGHKNQAVIQAIEEQARKLAYIMPGLRDRYPGGVEPSSARGAARRVEQVLFHNVGHGSE